MSRDWNWEPNVRLGPIKLGEPIEGYLSLGVALDEDKAATDITGWIGYKWPKLEVFIYAEQDRIVAITSYEFFFYKGENIIGKTIPEFEHLLEGSADEIGNSVVFDNGDVQTPYEYSALGLSLWESKGHILYASIIDVTEPE